jgi:Flp pilus assembly protein TadB
MKVRNTMRVCTTLLAAILTFAGYGPANGQEKSVSQRDHAVSAGQLRKDVQKAADTRQTNEAAVREMFASDQAKETLKSAGIDYKQVDQAISQVNDEDLSRMAQRSQEVRDDFAAGRLGDRDLLIILLVAVAIILIVVAVR